MNALIAALLTVLLALPATAAIADDWVAVKLRGSVFAYVDGAWERLARGDVVSDQRQIRTQRSGHVTFERDRERIDIGPNTQISIVDRTGRRYTTVKQYFGTVEVQANVEDVQHFAVQTPYLAAIVKGTNFVVTSGSDSSRVKVKRGRVLVDDLASTAEVLLSAGQSAQTTASGLAVSGRPAAEASPSPRIVTPGPFNSGGSTGTGAPQPASVDASSGLEGVSTAVTLGSTTVDATVGGAGISADANVEADGVSASASVDTSSGLSAAVDLSVGDAAGASVDTGGVLSSGDEPPSVSVQTPVGNVGLSLPLGL